VGHSSAVGVLDWGLGLMVVAVDDDQGRRRGSGEGGDRSRRYQVNCACANARASVLGALGGARDPGEDRIMQKQELALRRRAWWHGEARMAAGTACCAWKRVTGRSKAAVSHGVTRGVAGKQELVLSCCDGEQRREANRRIAGRRGTAGRRQRGSGGRWRWAGVARGLA
jgi:hypothetical protein